MGFEDPVTECRLLLAVYVCLWGGMCIFLWRQLPRVALAIFGKSTLIWDAGERGARRFLVAVSWASVFPGGCGRSYFVVRVPAAVFCGLAGLFVVVGIFPCVISRLSLWLTCCALGGADAVHIYR